MNDDVCNVELHVFGLLIQHILCLFHCDYSVQSCQLMADQFYHVLFVICTEFDRDTYCATVCSNHVSLQLTNSMRIWPSLQISAQNSARAYHRILYGVV